METFTMNYGESRAKDVTDVLIPEFTYSFSR